MCFYTSQKASKVDLEARFKAFAEEPENIIQEEFINGFSYPHLPIILDKTPEIITTSYSWGLIPNGKPIEVRKNLLNARAETVEELPSFSNFVQNRCLIISTGYWEWRWLDEKGKKKEKYNIFSQQNEIFTFAGIYTAWKGTSGEEFKSYTMLTTKANNTMEFVHNHKKRMPIMLKAEDEKRWLDASVDVQDFEFPKYDAGLMAIPFNPSQTLF
jgi:putative SOS response-associated peptidase YedK